MLNIYRIDHIAQVVPELAPQVELLEDLFGFRRLRTWESSADRCKGATFEIPGSAIRWQVLAPLGDDSPLEGFLGPKRRPGLRHIAVEVPEMKRAVDEIGRLGLAEPTGVGEGGINSAFDSTLLPADGPKRGLLWRLFGPDLGTTPGNGRPQPVPPAATQDGTLGITTIDHVCQAYRDRDALARHYERLFGFREIWRTPDDEHRDLADLVMNIPGSAARWEIIMPWGKESFIERFLDHSGAAVHHVTFEVRDWDAALAACARGEIPTFDASAGETSGAKWRDTFIHPKHTGGVLVQLFWEEHPGVWCRSDKIPARG